jgi:hypothetical protein
VNERTSSPHNHFQLTPPSRLLFPSTQSYSHRADMSARDRMAAAQQQQAPASAAAESASPIGIANLPNQRHKIVAKRGAAFTIMVGSPHRLHGLTLMSCRSPASLGWARLPSSTPSSPPRSRTIKITSGDMPSRSTRQSKSRSPRLSWKRSSSRVRPQITCVLTLLTCCSPPHCHRYPWLRRLCQQSRFMDAHHRIPRRSTRVVHVTRTTTQAQ